MIDLRHGDWRETILGVECDSLISDPPYSARTHALDYTRGDGTEATTIDYDAIDRDYVEAFVASWVPRVRHWWVVFGDQFSNRWWIDALDAAGLQTFAPVIWCKRGAAPRLRGDGPASQVEYVAVARTRGAWATNPPWGSLPGWYSGSMERADGVVGCKPVDLMRALVRDYSRPGWILADPHAGSGTTLVAARLEHRTCIGSERDPATYEIARSRLAGPYTPDLFSARAAS